MAANLETEIDALIEQYAEICTYVEKLEQQKKELPK
jgi:hypothetical protein